MLLKTLRFALCATLVTVLQACGGGGGGAGSGSSAPIPPPAPGASLSTSVADVKTGGVTTLTWSSTNATSCMASGDWSGSLASSGSQTVTATKVSSSYGLSCSGPGGTANAATVTVKAWDKPTATISASPTVVLSGGTTQLTWSSTNASACTSVGGSGSAVALSGTQTTAALTTATTYSFQCTNPVYTTPVAASVTITIQQTYSLTVTAIAESPGKSIRDARGWLVPDWTHPVQLPVPYVWIELQDTGGKYVAGSYANGGGAVTFTNLDPSKSYVPVLKSKSKNENGFDLWVVNNTLPIDKASSQFRARYAVYEGHGPAYVAIPGKTVQATQILAGLGWDSALGKLVDANRASGPYLLLSAMNAEESVIKAAAGTGSATTPQLTVLWSATNNTSAAGAVDNFDNGTVGQITHQGSGHNSITLSGADSGTGYIEDAHVYVTGAQTGNLDEFWATASQHEFFHHVQATYLRFFNPAGSHGSSGYYDQALAYAEGTADVLPIVMCGCSEPLGIRFWAAAGGLITASYGDSSKPIAGAPVGWFQESTIQRLAWSLLDPAGLFHLSGAQILAPLFTTAETTSRYMPTIWSYAKQFKILYPTLASKLDTLGAGLNIDFSANDEFGTNESHLGNVSAQDSLPIFTNLPVGGSARVCTTGKPGDVNKLGNSRYIRINVPVAGYHNFSIVGPSGSVSWFEYQWTENNKWGYSYPRSGTNTFNNVIALAAGESVMRIGDCSVNNSKTYCGAALDPPAEQCWSVSLQ